MGTATYAKEESQVPPKRIMQAIVQSEYGSSDVLRQEETERPAVGDDEVLVKVRTAGIDRGTWHLMTGRPYLIRAIGYGLRAPKNPVPGLDVAGTVEAVGSGVTRFTVGDAVFGIAKGSLAEYASAREDKLAHKPDGVSFESAGVTSVSGLTALQGLRDIAKVEPGHNVLIVGASGGVGTFAVQLAKAFGAKVTGVSSTPKVDLVRSLGADRIVDYLNEDFADGTERYDVILDVGGNSSLKRLRRALAPKGTLVIVGGEEGGRWFGGIDRQLRALLLSPFIGQRLTTFVSKENSPADLDYLAELIEGGELTPVIDSSYPLQRAPEGICRLEDGRAGGKVSISTQP